jgi:multicomponent Na+:H+ antiporter subunit D
VEPSPVLPIVVPMIVGVTVAGASHVLPRRVTLLISIVTAAVTALMCTELLIRTRDEHVVDWLAGWQPRDGLAIGISLVVDQVGAGFSLLAATLVTLALVFSWHFYEEESAGERFESLMLLFLGAMVGFALTGDLFNMFVFFELMSIAAFALTGFEIEEAAPLQGGINFAVTNTIGSFCFLTGIALLYARTGALNMAQIGEVITNGPIDGLLIVAFVCILFGLFVKAAIVPFHFWLADAHAVAPTPVCVIFSGIMVELALYGLARLYWSSFEGAVGDIAAIRSILVVFGVVTAIVGAIMCFSQQHLKRLLAFSTISHTGLFLVGLVIFDHVATAGVLLYVAGHGLVKGALFMCAGIVLHRLGEIDEEDLRGKGRGMYATMALFVIGALALAGMPPFGNFVGKSLIEDTGSHLGYVWISWLFAFTSAITAAAVLRATARIFLGWGPNEPDRYGMDRTGEKAHRETWEARDHTPATMFVPAALLLTAAFALGVAPMVWSHFEDAAQRLQDRHTYVATVLQSGQTNDRQSEPIAPSSHGVPFALGSTIGAVAIAALALSRQRIASSWRKPVAAVFSPPLAVLRRLHSGHIGDYVTWQTVGFAVLGISFALVFKPW